MNSSFFDAIINVETTINKPVEYKVYYAEDSSIIEITTEEREGKYIVITQLEYDACMQKQNEYKVEEEKLIFSPPVQKTWNLQQQDLARNPYLCKQ